ncbi:acyl-CoA desaturase [Streptomyces gardneri]|jgi:linoleoyl-CoA desaturase|uniref:fatty acid desaturase family protein n=1 Tax=Nocardia TaxID=1817 RepID=UPI001358C7D3|nr:MULTISPECIES: acyl-CoA desaturase [Nocardia]MBF6167975.1 acyl-CoA desaturase [Streptomyces gardneri]MBF6206755.1 acyl-CoA desaturase [Streptomyces gardneri]
MTILTETENGPLVLSPDQIEELGRELDELRAAIVADLGERDREYLYSIIKAQRGFEIAGRGLMYLGFLPPVWLAAVAALSVSKILDNMEIGHNVMHGQYDWMREPGLNSRVFEWDTVCPADQWKHSHNYLHHTYTNIHNKDRDIGYSILRMDEAQEWNVLRLGQPVYAFVLMMLFEWGVMGHDLEVENILAGKKKWPEVKKLLLGQWRKAGRQVLKDYLVFPALTGPLFFHTLAGNATANLVRNVWAFAIIFCGHFPTGVQTFTEEETADETRGEWYIRQMLGSANITGSKLFHIMSGNLSHQIEHHLFPDLPASRYPEMAPTVRALCEKYGLPYNAGPLGKQIGSVWKKIFKLALPPRWVESEPSPGVIVMRQPKASEAGV